MPSALPMAYAVRRKMQKKKGEEPAKMAFGGFGGAPKGFSKGLTHAVAAIGGGLAGAGLGYLGGKHLERGNRKAQVQHAFNTSYARTAAKHLAESRYKVKMARGGEVPQMASGGELIRRVVKSGSKYGALAGTIVGLGALGTNLAFQHGREKLHRKLGHDKHTGEPSENEKAIHGGVVGGFLGAADMANQLRRGTDVLSAGQTAARFANRKSGHLLGKPQSKGAEMAIEAIPNAALAHVVAKHLGASRAGRIAAALGVGGASALATHLYHSRKDKKKHMAHGGIVEDDEDSFLSAGMHPEHLGHETYPDHDNTEHAIDPESHEDDEDPKMKRKKRLSAVLEQVRARHAAAA